MSSQRPIYFRSYLVKLHNLGIPLSVSRISPGAVNLSSQVTLSPDPWKETTFIERLLYVSP